MKSLHTVALILTIIGALNWGLVGFFEYDLVAAIFGGPMEPLSRIVYALVGLAGLVLIGTSSAMLGRTSHTSHHREMQHRPTV